MISSFLMKLKDKAAVLALALVMVLGLAGMPVETKAAVGDTPPHSKSLTDNHDGTYTLSLDVVGDSEKKPNNINVIVIVDTSGSMTQTRMTAAKNAVNSLANALYAYNTQSEPDTVEMALVRFATSSSVARTPTNTLTQFRTAVNNLGNTGNGGTNWESALQTANGVDFGDEDQTFAIFVSDGNPTFRTTQNGWNDWSYQYQQWGSGQETATNIQRCYTTAVDDAAALATKVTPGNFFTIGAFGNVDRMEQLTDDAGSDSSTNYYSASDTAALNKAISDILAKIEMAGIGNTEIDDGTTNQVTTTSGEVAELLEVDESSYKYYRSGGTYGSMAPWADAPEAELVNGTVEWDLSSVGVLENGVRYTVTFDVYPSQYTYDTIAKLKNGDITYDSLDAEVKKYIVDNGGGDYSLRTNTNASLSWDDTRDDEGQQTDAYVNPDPVGTDAEQLTVNKEWEGADPDVTELPITVMMGDEEFHTATLCAANNWETSSYISVGIIKNGQALPGALGHDFSFAELDDTQYRWELDAPTVRPMLVNGTLTMLIKVDADHPAPSGATTYTIEGSTYYVDSAASGLTATNYRRSNLNLTKTVTGEDAPEDATFPFTLTVNNSKAPATAPADDTEHNSDYWVWFSIYDTKAGATVTDATVSGATGPNADGYYYAPSGSAISVQMKDGWNLRFTNLPSKTTYTFVEGDLDDGFAFKSAELTQGTDSTFSGGQTTTGTIENTTTSYYVEYTNDYELTDLEITKVWNDANNQDGKRLTADELKAKLTLAPAVEDKEPTIVDNGDNTYTITYTGLPRFNNGEEVKYTVTESEITGYTTEGSPAEDHGTITNTHVPEVTEVTVVKVWEDSNDIGKIRPTSLNVQLTADGKASGDPVALNADSQWTYTWENLPKYKDGTEIVYSADETAVPSGYTKTGPENEDGTVTFTVTNTYNPTPVTVDPPVQKIITGNDNLYNKGDFTFKIEAVTEGAPMPENTEITNSADYELEGKTGFYEFGEITFTMPGTYEYKVTESGTVDGVTNDPDAATGKTLTFTVTDAGTGKLVVSPTTDQVQLSFTNVYNADGEASIVVSKEITGAAWPSGKTLTLTITGANGTPMPKATTASLTAAGSVTFGPIEYGLSDAGKSYEYTITEDSFGAGWSGAPANVKATVAVTDNGDGTLGTTVTYSPEDAKFTNTYKATGTANIEATKAITGAAWPADKTITFSLAGTESAPMPAEGGETVTLTEAGKATFGEITYTEADAGKTYTYTISENGFGTGWTGSPASITATVEVTDNGNGTLSTTVTYDPEDKTITNTYEATGEIELFAGKKLDAADGLNAPDVTGKYTLTLEAQDGAPMPEGATDGKVEITNADGNGTMTSFGTIAFNESHAGNTYTYKVTETGTVDGVTNGTTEYTVSVTVTDNGNGTLTATASPNANTLFTNTYNVEPTTASFPVKKILSVPEGLDGPATWSYTINVAANGEAPVADTMEGTVSNTADTANFGPFTYTAPGEYTYTVSETGTIAGVTNDADAAGKTVTVTVVDNGDGTMTATATSTEASPLTFTNTYSVGSTTASFPVKKILSVPEGLDGPATWSYTINVAANGEAPVADTMEGTVSNTADTANFGPFTYTAPGEYTYTVSETGTIAGVTNDAEAAGKTVTVTVVDNGNGGLTASVSPESGISFTNAYDAEPTEATFSATKVLEGSTLQAGQFTFSLTEVDSDGKVVEGGVSRTATNAADGSISFEAISYTNTDAGKTFYYQMAEVIAEKDKVPGFTYDENVYTISVAVTDDKEGNLVATVTGADNLTFNNKFTPVDVFIKGEKKIVGRDMVTDETFEFTLTPTGDTATAVENGEVVLSETAAKATVKNAKDGTPVDFQFGSTEDPIQFTKVGTYTFTVTETPGSRPMTYDTSREVTVTVFSNNGVLDATYSFNGGSTFVNIYKAEGEVTLTGTKRLYYTVDETVASESEEGTEGGNTVVVDNADGTLVIVKESAADGEQKDLSLKGGEFQFEVRYAKGDTTTVLATGENGAAAAGTPATITFSGLPISYTNEQLKALAEAGIATKTAAANGAAIYTIGYVVTEVKSSNPAMQGNTQTFAITATLTDNLDGTFSTEYSGDVTIAFENRYVSNNAEVDLEGLKVLEGVRPLAAGEFTFTISGDGPLPASTTVSNEAGGAVKFGTIKFNKDNLGDSTEKTFTYTIAEQSGSIPGVTYDTAGKTVTITVKDDGEGHITATTSPASAPLFTATNTYTPSPVSGPIGARKELTGRPLEAGEFTFTLTDADGNVVSTKTNDASGNVMFDAVEFTEAGDYAYTIAEVNNGLDRVTYDTNTYNVTAHVTNNFTTGGLDLEWITGGEIVFHNTYAPRIGNLSVTKVVTGEGADLTKSFDFTVTLGDASINGAYGGMTFTNGVAQFSLTNGQTLTATGLPENTTYTVTEADYSAEFYTTTIENGSGTIPLDGTAAATFTNYFQDVIGGSVVSPVATKYFENGTMTDGEFSFEIKDESGKVVSTGTNDADGNITFKPIAYGKESLAGEASKSFTYTVYEVIPAAATAENEYTANGITYDTSVKTIHVDVSRDENGQVAAVLTDNSDKLTFTNVGETLDGKTVSAKKLWADEVGDELEWPEGVTVKVELLADGQATGMFANLTAANPEAAFANLSNDVTYTIREAGVTGLDGDYTAAISGDDEVGFTVTNTVVEPKRVSVLKTWEDSKGRKESWPKKAEVIVELLADGQPTGRTAKLTADSPSAVFEDLDTNVTYSVRENSVKGVSDSYEVSITGDETDGFTITNSLKPPKETEPPTGIRTGDNTPILPYLATLLGALLIAITAGMGFGLKRRSR